MGQREGPPDRRFLMLAVWLVAGEFSDLPGSWQVLGLAAAISTLALSVVGVFSAVWKGALVPGPTHNREMADKDQIIDELRREKSMWQSATLKAMGQTDQLLLSGQVTRKVVEALPHALGVTPDWGEQQEEPGSRP